MTNIFSLQNQYDYTVQLDRVFRGNFSIDDVHIVETYFHFTQLNPFIFRWLKEQRQLATKQKLDPHYAAVKGDYQHYLDKRISALRPFISVEEIKNQSSSKPENDLWRESLQTERQPDAPLLEKLLKASLDTQDILFNCEQVLSHLPVKATECGEELDSFIAKTLPTYLNLISNLIITQKTEILDGFKNLQVALLKREIEEAQVQLALVRKNIGCLFSNTA